MPTTISGSTGVNQVAPNSIDQEDLKWVPPFTKEYVSPEQTITSAGLLTLAHGLGVVPKLFRATIICKVSEHGYSIGDTVEVPVMTDITDTTAANKGMALTPNSTNLIIRLSAATCVFQVLNKSTGVSVQPTNTSWNLIMRAWA